MLPKLTLPYANPITAAAAKRMRSNRRSDTKPEVSLRSALHRIGLRFRKDYAILLPSGKTVHCDVVFPRRELTHKGRVINRAFMSTCRPGPGGRRVSRETRRPSWWTRIVRRYLFGPGPGAGGRAFVVTRGRSTPVD